MTTENEKNNPKVPGKRTRTEEPRFRVRKPDYTLADLLAQMPKSEASEQTEAAEKRVAQPVREYPEEAYCFELEDPGYTLEDLLAQMPKSEASEPKTDACAGQPVRQYPEEAYDFEFEDPGYTLEDLLAQVTEDNRHEVVDFGPPVGKEVW